MQVRRLEKIRKYNTPTLETIFGDEDEAESIWLDRATIQFRFFGPSSFNTALQLVLRPHFLVNFV
jgi:hypothetical protein